MNRIEIEAINYEKDRLNFFTERMHKANKKYKRLFKKYKDAPYLSEEAEMLSDAGREAQFYGDVVELLEKALATDTNDGNKVSSGDICVVCGEHVPEGRQICSMCETGQRFMNKRRGDDVG